MTIRHRVRKLFLGRTEQLILTIPKDLGGKWQSSIHISVGKIDKSACFTREDG